MQTHLIRFRNGCAALAALAGTTLFLTGAPHARGEVLVRDAQKVAFLGDSITAGGWGNPGGYVRLVVAGLAANGVKVTPIPAGISGHKSDQMLERLKRDVLDKQPDWMTLSCGVNDVWHGARGVPLPAYRSNITAIVERCQAAGVKVVVLTATVIMEDLANAENQKLAPYNEFLRELAREKKCPLADLNALFQEAIKATAKPGRALTSDGVHMNPAGDQLMARGVLRAFGLDEAQLRQAQEAWLDIPGGASVRASFEAAPGKSLRATHKVTLRQHSRLQAVAAQANQPLEALLKGIYATEVKKVLKPAGSYASAEAIFQQQKEKEVQTRLQEQFGRRVEELLRP